MKDRRELKSGGNTMTTFVGGTALLEINSVSETEAGDYLCKASNTAGSNFCKSRVTIKGNQVLCAVKYLSIFSDCVGNVNRI